MTKHLATRAGLCAYDASRTALPIYATSQHHIAEGLWHQVKRCAFDRIGCVVACFNA